MLGRNLLSGNGKGGSRMSSITAAYVTSRPRLLSVRQVATWALLAAPLVWWFVFLAVHHNLGFDAHAYWITGHRDVLYGPAPRVRDAYLYSPAFAQAIWPLTWLPWAVFGTLWMGAEAAVFVWLLRPIGPWAIPAFIGCLTEVSLGNLYAFYALVLVLGFRRPAVWALPLLTKITPGVGILWFALRREWRQMAVLIGFTALIAAVSFLISPTSWGDWLRFLHAHRSGLSIRWALAAGCTAWAVKRDRPWLLAPAMVLALPMLDNISPFTILAAIPRMRLDRQQPSDRDAPATPEKHMA